MRKHLWIGYVFAAVCLYFAFRGISFRLFSETLKQAQLSLVCFAVAFYSIDFFLRSGRWAVLIRPVQKIPAKELFWPMLIGFFSNNVLPFRMGEFVRAHVCGTKFNISRTASLGSIFLERICDTLAFLTTFLTASLFMPFPSYMEKGAWLLGGGCVLALVVLIVIRMHEQRFHSLLESSPFSSSWKTKIRHVVTHFIHSTSGITKPRYVIEAMALSLVIWVIEGTFLYLIAHAFALNLKYGEAFFLLFALGLSVTLPQAPGYVGTFEFFGVTALSLLGIPKSQGLPVVLAVHGIQFVTISVLGCIGLWKEGLTLHSLTTTTTTTT